MDLKLPKTHTQELFICALPPRFGSEHAEIALRICDPRKSRYSDPESVLLGTYEVTIDVPQISEQCAVNQMIANLEFQRDALLGEAQAQAQILNRRINELFALEHKGGEGSDE